MGAPGWTTGSSGLTGTQGSLRVDNMAAASPGARSEMSTGQISTAAEEVTARLFSRSSVYKIFSNRRYIFSYRHVFKALLFSLISLKTVILNGKSQYFATFS